MFKKRLKDIHNPTDLRALDKVHLKYITEELRAYIIEILSKKRRTFGRQSRSCRVGCDGTLCF